MKCIEMSNPCPLVTHVVPPNITCDHVIDNNNNDYKLPMYF